MSRRELADAVNEYLWKVHERKGAIDAAYVGKLERGDHRWPHDLYREGFRTALGAASDAALGFFVIRKTPSAPQPPTSASDGPGAESYVASTSITEPLLTGVIAQSDLVSRAMAELASPVIAALLSSVPGMTGRAEPRRREEDREAEALSVELSKVRRAYQHSRYAAAMAALPELLVGIHRERGRHDDHQLSMLEAETYQVASGLLLKSGEPVLATIAAERCGAAAERSENELAIGCGARAYAHCLMAVGHPGEAVRLAVAAADGLSVQVNSRQPAALSVHGALLLRAAVAAARAEDRDQAHHLLDGADRAAQHLGADRNLLWTAFGPTNVTAHRIAVSVELGDAGAAVAYANKINLAALELPERKAMVLIDTARALTQWGKWDRAFDAIRRAERYAPEEIRQRAAVHRMIDELAHRGPTTLRRHVQDYAETIGMNR